MKRNARNDNHLALNHLLQEWGESVRLRPAEAEAIRIAALQSDSESAFAHDYAWWESLFKAALPNNQQVFAQIFRTNAWVAQEGRFAPLP